MAGFVVDASVGLKWAIPEPDSHHALALLVSGEELLVPDFWLGEATNVIWVQVHRGKWTRDQARKGLALLRSAVTPTGTVGLDLHPIALEIGMVTGHSPYDCLYVAFALAMGADHVIVADGPFHRAMRKSSDSRMARLLLPLAEWAESDEARR